VFFGRERLRRRAVDPAGMPPEIRFAARDDTPQGRVRGAGRQWRAYVEAHPESAVGHIELYRAMRLRRRRTPEEREALVRKALETDPDCPESPGGDGDLTHMFTQARDEGRGSANVRRSWPRRGRSPISSCAPFAMTEGNRDEVRKQLQAILDEGGISSPVLDFGYNLLMSAEPNRHPPHQRRQRHLSPLALQAVRGVRPDVLVVNLSLLNIQEYAVNVWKGASFGSPPFSKSALQERHTQWTGGKLGKDRAFSQVSSRISSTGSVPVPGRSLCTWRSPSPRAT